MLKENLHSSNSTRIIDETRRVIDGTKGVFMETAAEALAAAHQVISAHAIIEILDGGGFERSAMDRALVVEHLRQARNHVAAGERHIREQQEMIARLERDGHETALARQLLATLEETQALHVSERDRLTKELAKP